MTRIHLLTQVRQDGAWTVAWKQQNLWDSLYSFERRNVDQAQEWVVLAKDTPVDSLYLRDGDPSTCAILTGVHDSSELKASFFPIRLVRGLPEDLSLEGGGRWGLLSIPPYRKCVNRKVDREDTFYLGDGYHSWLTLDEILDTPLESNRTLHPRVLSWTEYQTFRDTGNLPAEQGLVDHSRPIYTQNTVYRWCVPPELVKEDTQVEVWESLTYAESAPALMALIADLQNLALERGVGPEDVRIVFGVDDS